jgi:GT2 family glycosyltransferase
VNERPAVTVVFAALNHGATLPALLRALDDTDWPGLRAIAVDCGSADGSLDLLRRRAAAGRGVPLQLLELPGRGRATALRAAMQAAGRSDVVRLHADVVPDATDWLQQLWSALERHRECGIVGGKIAMPGGRIQSCGRRLINGLGIAPEWSDLRWLEADADEPVPPREVDGVAGELCWIRRAVLDATGGLDPNFDPVHGCDDDLCLQARWHGFTVMVAPAVRGVHHAPRWNHLTPDGIPEPTGTVQKQREAADRLRRCHRDYFQRKWGFDPEAPDLHEIRRRYGHTRICWQIGSALRETLPPRPAVDVCLVTWNSRAVLPRMLDLLATTRWPELQVWVTDNGSTDDTVAYLRERAAGFPFPLHIEALPQNLGVAQALNLAFRRGRAPLVARLDDDTFVGPDWLEGLVPNFHQRPYAGVVGPRILNTNEGESLQNGPSRGWPEPLPGTGPGDAERVRGKARVHAICGCCNVYRRSVFARIGLLDVRFSPSQFDESDHHVALHVAGYEAIYDGSVTVHHQRNAGRSETPAAYGNFLGNKQKHAAKWAGRAWQAIDRAIDLSIDGRLLPPDGDTSVLWARLPEPPPGPPRPQPRDRVELRDLLALARRNSLLRSGSSPLQPWWRNQIARCEQALALGPNQALRYAVRLRDLLGTDPRALLAVARWQAADGEWALAARTARSALRLQPDDAELAAAAAPLLQPRRPAATATPPVAIPRPSGPWARVVLLAPIAPDPDTEALLTTIEPALRRRGVTVRIDRDLVPDVRGAEVVHAFGDERATLLGRLQVARAMQPTAHFVLSPRLVDGARAEWARPVLGGSYFANAERLWQLGDAVMLGMVEVGGHRDRRLPAAPDPDGAAYLRRAAALADTVLTLLPAEGHWWRNLQVTEQPLVQVDEGVPCPPPAAAIAAGAVMLGTRTATDHHLLATVALAGSGTPLTLAGDGDLPYGDWHLPSLGGPDLTLAPAPPTAAAAAALLAEHRVLLWLPAAPRSFRVPLQAALAGAELVLIAGVGAEEVFGPHATYVDPFALTELRHAVVAAAARWTGDRDVPWRHQLADRHHPDRFADRLLAAYRLSATTTTNLAGSLPIAEMDRPALLRSV